MPTRPRGPHAGSDGRRPGGRMRDLAQHEPCRPGVSQNTSTAASRIRSAVAAADSARATIRYGRVFMLATLT